MTLATATVEGETYRVAYSSQGATLLQDANGNEVKPFFRDDRDVAWDVSASGADMRVRLDVSGAIKTASLVKGGATTGTTRSLAFRYTVKASDTDADGVFARSVAADRRAGRGTRPRGVPP